MNILAFETSIGGCSVALLSENKTSYVESENQMMQSEELIIMVNRILKDNNLTYQDLSAVSCSIGPGSFTGIRVGIAAARGMKKALKNVKLIGVSTLEILAHNSSIETTKEQRTLAILKAYGDEFYIQEFDSNKKAASDIQVVSESTLLEEYKKYDMVLSHKTESLPTSLVDINALSVLNLAKAIYKNDSCDNNLTPLYIKKPNIHKK